MASIKAIAAIAMTLIVAVPILMGYGFASTEATVTDWESESTTNVTDLLLNNSTEYYSDYMSPLNNATFIQESIVQGGVEWHQVAPDYQSVGTTYTSLKEYSSASTETVSLTPATTESFSQESGTVAHSIGYSTGMDTTMSVSDYIYFTIESDYLNPIHWTVYLDSSRYYIGNTGTIDIAYFLLLRDSASSWMLYIREGSGSWSEYGSISTWEFYTDASYDISSSLCAYTAITAGTPYTFNLSGDHSVKITTSGGDSYIAGRSTIEVSLSASGLASVGGTTYTGVTAISVTKGAGGDLSVEVGGWTGDYADPALGWAIPVPESATAWYNWWYNGQQNHEVQLMIHFSGTNYVNLTPSTTTNATQLVQLYYEAGTGVTVTNLEDSTSTFLGDYDDVLAVVSDTKTTIYGLSTWPTMGETANVHNSVTVDYTDIGSSFAYLSIQDNMNGYTNEVTYRVDSAQIVAGSYPTTYLLNFDPAELFPDKSLIFTFKSVAAYGDRIGLNDVPGTSLSVYWDVVDGKITVDGETLSVRGLQIRVVDDGNGGWDAYLDDIKVAEGLSAPPKIWFGTEVWSLTASVDVLTQTTSTQQTWAPGEFAFSKEDFAACGLLVAGACLVGLGMTGRRSGIKMGMLLMICGGAGLFYLTII